LRKMREEGDQTSPSVERSERRWSSDAVQKKWSEEGGRDSYSRETWEGLEEGRQLLAHAVLRGMAATPNATSCSAGRGERN
jgi:hypothetical protein